MCSLQAWEEHTHLETKYLLLGTPVELGTWFDDWQMCWLGGWSKYHLYSMVMLVKVPLPALAVAICIHERHSIPGSERRYQWAGWGP